MTRNNPKLDLVNVDVHTKFGQLILNILSGNYILTSIKGCYSVKSLQKMTGNNSKLDHVNVDMHTKFGPRFCLFVLDILSGNEILTSIKGRNSVKCLRKMTGDNPKLDHSMLMCIQNLVRFYPFVLEILSGNEILMSIKGRN